ncbi:MAG TPA: prepilin-type cleavage/methylation domain-containing protein [Syntrophobacteraceae bacterium]|nr:prepilin-type cleavage/methylation domain-containing protein [Syntrophobacteraceae bacterium]
MVGHRFKRGHPPRGIPLADFSFSSIRLRKCSAGFTIFELMVAVLIAGILVAVGVSSYNSITDQARVTRAIADIYGLSMTIAQFEARNGSLPQSLADVGEDNFMDPWGNPYQYLRIADSGKPGKGEFRKDHNMVPVNTDYDLYSMGKDGKSASPFTAKISQDDVVRAKDGSFVGLVSDY